MLLNQLLSTIIGSKTHTIAKYAGRKRAGLFYALVLLQNPITHSFIVVSNNNNLNKNPSWNRLFATTTKGEKTKNNNPNNLNNNATSSNYHGNNPTKVVKNKIITDKLVVVHRNKQSLEFRNGSPLVFSGAISYTTEKSVLNINNVNNDDNDSKSSSLPMCSLVTVAVSRDENNNSKNSKSKRNGKSKKPTTYPHNTTLDNIDAKSLLIIGYGIYNPNSMYRVRILCHESIQSNLCAKLHQQALLKDNDEENNNEDKERLILESILKHKMKTAIKIRKYYLNLPNERTDTFRLLNNEGDGLSGLCVDVIGNDIMVVMSSAAWCEYYKDSIVSVLKQLVIADDDFSIGKNNKDIEVIWRSAQSRLEQDGYYQYTNTTDNNALPQQHSDDEKDKSIVIKENNIQYKVYPYSDSVQKTGFYCDQRINRQTFASLCANKHVLDLCCFNGSFSLNAAAAKAKLCIGIDSSADAITSATENAILNSSQDICTFIQMDVEDYMKQCIEEKNYFDVVVLDPPKLAPTISTLTRATRKYKQLNKFALQLINPTEGGMLLTCTCSSAMTLKDGGEYFVRMVREASLASKRDITLLSINGASPCHTQNVAGFPMSGKYLTAALFHVAPIS